VTDYDVGYGKPPKHSRFKKGVSGNPRGRVKRGDPAMRDILDRVLNAKIDFRERGKLKKASRKELNIKRLVVSAMKGDLSDAAMLLKLRANAAKHPDGGPTIIQIIGGAPYSRSRNLPEMPLPDQE
jgi:hypothetical protein